MVELGRGAFGVVHKVKDVKGNVFALKHLKPTDEVTDREVEIVKEGLQHDNIVNIHEIFNTRDNAQPDHYILMEYCDGGDLNDYMVTNKPKLNQRFEFMLGMARGVLYLHSINIVHRDLKPENILLKKAGTNFVCKISDFGMSKVRHSRHDLLLWKPCLCCS